MKIVRGSIDGSSPKELEMDTSNDIFQSRLYRINRMLLSLLGQWPFQKNRHRWIIFLIVSLIGITQAVAQVHFLHYDSYN